MTVEKGLMCQAYGGEYKATVGYRRKKYMNASLNSFILDTKNNKPWSLEDVMHLQGELSFCSMVEKEYFDNLIKKYNNKYNVNVRKMMKSYLNVV